MASAFVKKEMYKKLEISNWKPEWDEAPKSIYKNLIEEHIEVAKVQKDMELTCAQLKKKQNLINENWNDILQKKTNLKEAFTSSAKTIQANQASIYRIAEKIQEHKKQQQNLDLQINDLKSQKDNMTNIMMEMEQYVNKYVMYEEFLEQVAEIGSDFNSVGDILNRYECLEKVRTELEENLKEALDDIIKARKEMVDITEEKSSLLRNLDNKLINMQVKIKGVKENSTLWEVIVQRLKLMIIKKIEEADTFKTGCFDLYSTVYKRRQQAENLNTQTKESPEQFLRESETEKQLDYIQKSIYFYKEVLRIASSSKIA